MIETRTREDRVLYMQPDCGTAFHLPLKRRHSLVGITDKILDCAYPSPPMSGPPSPGVPEASAPSIPSTVSTSIASSQPPISSAAQSMLRTQPAPSDFSPFPAFTASWPPTPLPAASVASGMQQRSTPLSQNPYLPGPGPVAEPSSLAAATSPGIRGARKTKAHVASACVNCKRAHLSCDIQRPCARCMATGKQDTCYDVQHKKRGRPRLRDEGEFRVESPSTQTSPPATAVAAASSTARPIATPRHRRAESFRSMQSHTSEGSSSYGVPSPGYNPPLAPQSQHAATTSSPSSAGPLGYEVATAFFDMDLVAIRANRPFQQIMLSGQDVRGWRLGDLVTPVDGESFLTIRNRLRAERERRDPNYLPPILQAGDDPLQGIPEVEADRFAQGFEDHMYTWTQSQTQAGTTTQIFPARVRLARSATYFVIVTLPSFRPVEQLSRPPPQLYSAPFASSPFVATPETYTPRQPPGFPATSVSQHSYPGMAPPMQPPQQQNPMSARSWPPAYPSAPQQPYPYPQYHPPRPPEPAAAARPLHAEARVEAFPFSPGPSTTGLPTAAPTLTPTTPTSGPPSTQPLTIDTRQVHTDDDDGDDEGTSRKRRRMGIEDVLQR